MPCHVKLKERVSFSPEERVIHGLLMRRSDEKLILDHLHKLSPEELEEFNNKIDFKGRTLLVHAILGEYEEVVKTLLVRFENR